MKAYLITTGLLFALICLLHSWEIIDRGHFVVEDPIVILAAAGLSIWAWTLNARGKTP
ncbi:MAG TPA: hypothetical protein VGU74_11055 [Gemmatimonadales bacterium]|nr:hypothetical protein [Gemmatimonadales bacterium]